MGTSAKSLLCSDRELVAHLKLGVREVANFLGHSYRALEQGFATNQANLSKPFLTHEEIVQLRFFVHVLGKEGVDDSVIMSYVTERYTSTEVRNIRLSFAMMSEPVRLHVHDEVWVLIPDLRRATHDGRAEFLRELVQLPVALTIFLPHTGLKEQFFEFLGKYALESKVSFRYGNFVASQGTIALGDPLGTDAKSYIQKHDGGLVREPRPRSEVRYYAKIAREKTSEL